MGKLIRADIPWEQTAEGKAHRARRDVETLKDASEIHSDAARHKAAKDHANAELQKMSAVVHAIDVPVIDKQTKIAVPAADATRATIKDNAGNVTTKLPGSDTKAATLAAPKKTTDFSKGKPATKSNDAKPIPARVVKSGEMKTSGAKPSPIKPAGSRLEQWMDKRNKTAKR